MIPSWSGGQTTRIWITNIIHLFWRWLSWCVAFSNERGCIASISILLFWELKKGTPSNPVFSVASKNSGKLLLTTLTAVPAICLGWRILTLMLRIWYLSPAFLTEPEVVPPLFLFNVGGKKDKKGKLVNIFSVNNENKTRKKVLWWIKILNIKHVTTEKSQISTAWWHKCLWNVSLADSIMG